MAAPLPATSSLPTILHPSPQPLPTSSYLRLSPIAPIAVPPPGRPSPSPRPSFVPYRSTPRASSIKSKEQDSKIKDEKKNAPNFIPPPHLSATRTAQLGPTLYLPSSLPSLFSPFLPPPPLPFLPFWSSPPLSFPALSTSPSPSSLCLRRLLHHVVMKQLKAGTLILLSLCSSL